MVSDWSLCCQRFSNGTTYLGSLRISLVQLGSPGSEGRKSMFSCMHPNAGISEVTKWNANTNGTLRDEFALKSSRYSTTVNSSFQILTIVFSETWKFNCQKTCRIVRHQPSVDHHWARYVHRVNKFIIWLQFNYDFALSFIVFCLF